MGHKQPKTPVHSDNATAVRITNNTVKQQHLQSMEMRFFWISDKVAQNMYALSWHPGHENLADYQSKHHTGAHHIAVCLWQLHMGDFYRELSRALAPSALKGFVGTLNDRYVRKVPLPRAPQIQSTRQVTCNVTVTHDWTGNTYYLGQVPLNPTWHDLSRSIASICRTTILPLLPVGLIQLIN
jgi:hypothetical protein